MSQPLSPPIDPVAQSRERRGPLFRICIGACVIVALATRWLFLGYESLWFDEGWTWWLISHPAGEMLRLMRADTVAPLYFYLLRGWTLLFGDDAAAMRSMSALLVTLALVPWAILARRTLNSTSGLLAASALVSYSFMATQYAREVRPYALLALLTLTALACVPAAVSRSRSSWGAMLGFAFCVTGGMYTHNVMGFYAVALAIAWLVWPGERRFTGRLGDLAIVVPIAVLLYLPWVPSMREQARWVGDNFWAARPHAPQGCIVMSAVCGVDVYDASTAFWATLNRSPGSAYIAVFVTICAAVALGLANWRADPAGRRRAMALTIVAVGPIMAVYVYSRYFQPIFLGRLFMTSSLLMPLILGLAIDRGRRRSIRVTAGVIALMVGLLAAASTVVYLTLPQKEDWRGAYEYVAKLPPSPRRAIVFMATEGELPFLHYVNRDPGRPAEVRTGAPGGFFDIDPPRTIRRVKKDSDLDPMRATLAAGEFDEAVLVLSHYQWVDPTGITRAWFEKHWKLEEERKLRHVVLLRFRAR